MAGIGFSLKKLFSQKGLFGLCRAYGYAGLICAGPMILGVLLLTSVALAANVSGMSEHDRYLLNAMLTYCLLAALTVTSFFNMVCTRYVSDALYEEKPALVMPSFHGVLLSMMLPACILWAVFLFFCGVAIVYRVLCFWFFCILMVVWTQMNYLTALKDYKALVVDFALSLSVGAIIVVILLYFHLVTTTTLFLTVIIAYGILMTAYYRRLLKFFPKSEGSPWIYLRWFDRYGKLALSGLFVNIGLFAHLVIMYCSPLSIHIEGLFYGAPVHDVAALCAFFSILITTINFVTSVETNFYPCYHTYYSLFNDKGAIKDIDQAEEEMLSVLRRELTYNGIKQLFTTVVFIVLGSIVLQWVGLGFTDTSLSIFRILCIGYGLYALANSMMLILLYFEDYTGALLATGLFAAISVLGTILSVLALPIEYYGSGFAVGAMSFYLASLIRMELHTRKLPYYLLGRHELVARPIEGIFTRLTYRLEQQLEDKA